MNTFTNIKNYKRFSKMLSMYIYMVFHFPQ